MVIASLPATADDTQVITRLDDVTNAKNEVCWSLVPAVDTDAKRYRCPGLNSWRVEMVSTGGVTNVLLGTPAHGATPVEQLIPTRTIEPGQTIHWHLRNGQPVAVSLFYSFEGHLGTAQAVAVYKLAADSTSCIAAVIAEEKDRDLNAEAQRLAVQLVPGFRCGIDHPVTLGKQRAALR
ncbi:hypothetical protein BV133_2953 [Blastochloris viridis]|uniref:Uncharacterized protein n=1 Tax=Blastochloris viridis TaxID=1079 RepID=A0A182D4W2_BLAVI|nr:hypothetical protein BV133_2953 [Blastochloris viridis]